MKKIICLILFLGFFSVKIQAQEEDYSKSSLVKMGATIPDFVYKDINGSEKTSTEFKGKIVLINFFATWCGPCMVEMPVLQKQIWEKYKDNPDFKLISFGRDHSQAEMIDFIKKKNLSFNICPDKGKWVYNTFATQYIPRNYLIDKTGKVVYVSVGFSEDDFIKLEEKIKSLL